MARYKKGTSGNPAGKKTGTVNRTTKQAKEILNQVLFSEIDNIKLALNEIRIKDKYRYLDILAKLLTYSLPKKTDLTSDDEPLSRTINITVATQKGADELKDFLNGTATD
jgi:hypothetical protein